MSQQMKTLVRYMKQVQISNVLHRQCRAYTSQFPTGKTAGEERIAEILRQKFPGATFINVEDISGGCGSMYDLQIEAKEFTGKRTVMQHRMVNEALEQEIKDMHGLRIHTKVSSEGS